MDQIALEPSQKRLEIGAGAKNFRCLELEQEPKIWVPAHSPAFTYCWWHKFLAVNELSFMSTVEDLVYCIQASFCSWWNFLSRRMKNSWKFSAVSQEMRSTLVQKYKMM